MSNKSVYIAVLSVLSGASLVLSIGCGLPAPASDGASEFGQSVGEAAAAVSQAKKPVTEHVLGRSIPIKSASSLDSTYKDKDGNSGDAAAPSPESIFRDAVGLYGSGSYREAGDAALMLAVSGRGTVWEGRALFLAARTYAVEDDPAAAAALFGNARDKYPALADYAVYLSAQAYAKAERHDDAAAMFEQLVSDYPDSPLAQGAKLDAAREHVELEDFNDAAARLRGFLTSKHSPDRTSDALYLLMETYAGLGEYDLALAQYMLLWREYPGYAATVKAERLVYELAASGHAAPEPTLDDRLRRADRFFARGSYKSAAGAYSGVLDTLQNKSATRGEALVRLGRSYYSVRDNDKAMRAFREVIDGGYDGQAPDAYYWLSKTHLRSDESGLKDTVFSCRARFPGDTRTADCMYLLGVTALSDGDYELAKDVLSGILDGFPRSGRTDEVLWWLGLADYRLGDYPAAEATFGRLASGYPGSTLAPQALYWQAKSVGMQSRADEAYAIYSSLASGYGYSFYGLLASDGGSVDGGSEILTASLGAVPARTDVLSDAYSDGPFARVYELGLQGMKDEAARELRGAEDRYSRSLDGIILLSGAYNSIGKYQRPLELAGGLYGESINVGNGTVPDDALAMLFPLAYPDIVLNQASAFGIDPALVYAVIREESRFNPDAVSPAGAIGLMQLMPGTAKVVCARLNVGFNSSEQLKDEEFNVPLGTCYLASLVERHNGRLSYALAEYNAGPGPLKRWIERDPSASDEEFIEGITYYETRSYVKRVLRNYMMYRRLYGGKGAVSQPSPQPQ